MRVADLYIRVSTDEQADRGYSQRDQEERLAKYCEANSISIRKCVFEDYSAKSFIRPAWTKLLNDIKKQKGQTDLVLFTKWDRFSRNAGDAYQMISILRRLGVEPQAIEQPLDLSVPENKMMLAFYLAAPEVENDRRALNVIRGMRRAKKEGRWMGPAPIGYKNKVAENGTKYISFDEYQAPIMTWAFNEICNSIFNTEQIWREARKKGLRCTKNNFWVAIRNPMYCGKIFVPAFKDEPSMIVQGNHEPLITEVLFEDVQDVLNGRKRIYKPKIEANEIFTLKGFLKCPRCEKLLTASSSKGRKDYYHYYHCNSKCGFRHKAEEVNDRLALEIKKHVSGIPELKLYKDILMQTFRTKTEVIETEIKLIKQQLNDISQKTLRARDLLISGDINGEDFKEIKKANEKLTIRLEAKLEAVKPQWTNIEPLFKQAIGNISKLDVLYANGSVAQRRKIIGSIFPEKLTFDGNNFRTTKVNEIITYLSLVSKDLQSKKIGTNLYKKDLSHKVTRIGFEPMTLSLEG